MNIRKYMKERDFKVITLRDAYLSGRTTEKWTYQKIGERFGVGMERARQIYVRGKYVQMRAYAKRIKQRTGESISPVDMEKELGSQIAVTQYLEQRYADILND